MRETHLASSVQVAAQEMKHVTETMSCTHMRATEHGLVGGLYAVASRAKGHLTLVSVRSQYVVTLTTMSRKCVIIAINAG